MSYEKPNVTTMQTEELIEAIGPASALGSMAVQTGDLLMTGGSRGPTSALAQPGLGNR